MRIHNRVPQEFFTTQGVGQSDVTIHAGSYHHAMAMAGIADQNLIFYTSILPVGAKEVPLPPRGTLVHGSVLESIIAVAHATKGKRATAGLIYGYLRDRVTGEEIGGLVCEYSGDVSEAEARAELESMFQELYQASYADKYDFFNKTILLQSLVAEKRYASALVAICFVTAKIKETIPIESNIPFLGEQTSFRRAQNILIPVAFDATSSWLKGTQLGPQAILKASPAVEDFDIDTKLVVSQTGFHTMPFVITEDAEVMIERVEENVLTALEQKKIPCVIGGNHSVSIGAIRAMAAKYPNISVLHIDAHTDYRDSYEGNKWSHGSAMKRASEYTKNIVSVGIRSTSLEEQPMVKKAKIFYAADLMKKTKKQIEKIVQELGKHVYVTIDLDGLDIGAIPAVSTPEPGGLSWDFVTELLRKVASERHVVGFDVVELCPKRHLKASEFAAAKLIYSMFAYIHYNRGKK